MTLSIRTKLALLPVAGILLPLAGVLGIMASQDVRALRRQMIAADEAVVSVVSQYSAASVAFEDREAAAKDLARVARLGHAQTAALYDERGALFASWKRPGEELSVPRTSTPRPAPATLVLDDHLELYHPVVHDDVQYGTLALRVSTAPLEARTRAHLLILGGVGGGGLALALLFSFVLHRLISRRIFGLAQVALAIAKKADYSVRATPGDDDEIGTLAEAFNLMLAEIARRQQQAQDAIRVREEFIVVAAHELRTPLASLKLSNQILARALAQGTLGGDTGRRVTESAARQTKRLERLVGNLLDVNSLSSGRFRLEVKAVDLCALVREVCEDLRQDLERAGCTFAVTTPAKLEGRWDQLRLEQVLTNLLSNAIKYGAGGAIDVTVEDGGERARLVVRDHGIGISPADSGRIFARFERAVSSQHYGGLGLGLYITQQIVAAHGGAITVSSESGAGATFTVDLPRSGPPSSAGPA